MPGEDLDSSPEATFNNAVPFNEGDTDMESHADNDPDGINDFVRAAQEAAAKTVPEGVDVTITPPVVGRKSGK